MKKIGFYFGLLWKVALVAVIVVGVVVTLLFYRIGNLAPGYSNKEVGQYIFTEKSSNIRINPINSPITVPQYLIKKAGHKNIKWSRVVSASVGLLSILCFFLVIKSWHTDRIAYIATAMYATSSWLLLAARTGDSQILLTLLPLMIIIYLWLEQTKKRKLAVLSAVVIFSLLLYVPAGVLIIAAALSLRGKKLLSELKTTPPWFLAIMGVVLLILISPLLRAVTSNHNIGLYLLGLPTHMVSVSTFVSNIFNTFGAVFVNSNRSTFAQIGSVGLLDIFSVMVMFAGAIYYGKRFRLDRSKYLLIGTILALTLIGLGGLVTISVLLPLLYMLIAGGLAWLLHQWFTIFPRNPIARSVGMILLVAAVSVSIFFNTYRYFIAWPHMTTTKQTYNHRV